MVVCAVAGKAPVQSTRKTESDPGKRTLPQALASDSAVVSDGKSGDNAPGTKAPKVSLDDDARGPDVGSAPGLPAASESRDVVYVRAFRQAHLSLAFYSLFR